MKAKPSEMAAGLRIIVQRDEVGIFPASSRTPKRARLVATLKAAPEQYDPSMGRRKRWRRRAFRDGERRLNRPRGYCHFATQRAKLSA